MSRSKLSMQGHVARRKAKSKARREAKRMPLTESPKLQAIRELDSEQCSCGNKKKPKQSFCNRCYYSLSRPMQLALYRRFGSGYEEAYQAAKNWLKEEATTRRKR